MPDANDDPHPGSHSDFRSQFDVQFAGAQKPGPNPHFPILYDISEAENLVASCLTRSGS
jgi:hypothetical protein